MAAAGLKAIPNEVSNGHGLDKNGEMDLMTIIMETVKAMGSGKRASVESQDLSLREKAWLNVNDSTAQGILEVGETDKQSKSVITDASGVEHSDGESDWEELPPLTAGEQERAFIPEWSFTQGTMLTTPDLACQFIDQARPPAERILHRSMGASLLSDQYCVALAKNFVIGSEVHHRMIGYEKKFTRVIRRNSGLKEKLVSVTNEKQELLSQFSTREKKLVLELEDVKAKLAASEEENKLLKNKRPTGGSAIVSIKEENARLRSENARVIEERRWLICNGFRQVFEKIKASKEFSLSVGSVKQAAIAVGYQTGLHGGYHYSGLGIPIGKTPYYDQDAMDKLKAATTVFQTSEHTFLEQLSGSVDLSLTEIQALIFAPDPAAEPDT